MSLQVLLVDDQAQDRALVRRELTKHFDDLDVMEVSGPDDLDRAFGRDAFDLVISDYALGWADGLRVLHTAVDRWPRCRTIMYTGTGNEEVAVAAMKAGFDDYVVKSNHHLKRLPDVVRRALDREAGGTRWDTVERVQELREAAQAPLETAAAVRLLQAVTAASNGAETLSEALEVVLPELGLETGWPVAHAWRCVPEEGEKSLESSGIWCLFDPIGFDGFRRATQKTRLGSGDGLPGRAIRRGEAVWVEDIGRAVDSPRAANARSSGIGAGAAVPVLVNSEPVAVVELFHRQALERDEGLLEFLERAAVELGRVAARERAEERRAKLQARVLASRKMEAIGRLAGGLAHDFNNLLNVVILEAEDALGETDLPPGVRKSLGVILKTAERAGQLTRRLLTFGKRVPGTPSSVDVGEMVHDMQHLLGHVAGGEVTLRIRLEPPVARVWADRTQLEQVLVNLVHNAREALPDRGEIDVGVRRYRVPESTRTEPDELEAGDYVLVSVSDNGPGIPHGIKDRIFEPFFSTRWHGPGTGLGLSVCHALVQEMGGRIRVDSESGAGTTFEVILPARAAGAAAEERLPAEVDVPEEGRSILIVQDQDDLRSVLARMLVSRGYDVLAVSRGEEAMEVIESGRPFDLVITDVGLPGIRGTELAQRVRALLPGTAVMLTTGFGEMVAEPVPETELDVDDVVSKPFTLDELLSRMRRVLDTKRSATRAS